MSIPKMDQLVQVRLREVWRHEAQAENRARVAEWAAKLKPTFDRLSLDKRVDAKLEVLGRRLDGDATPAGQEWAHRLQ